MNDPTNIPSWPDLVWRRRHQDDQRVVVEAFTRWYDGTVIRSHWVMPVEQFESYGDKYVEKIDKLFGFYFQSLFHRGGYS